MTPKQFVLSTYPNAKVIRECWMSVESGKEKFVYYIILIDADKSSNLRLSSYYYSRKNIWRKMEIFIKREILKKLEK